MTDPRREGEGGRSARTTSESTEKGTRSGSAAGQESRTAGTNRDFDETEESKNQGHGHPREERGTKS